MRCIHRHRPQRQTAPAHAHQPYHDITLAEHARRGLARSGTSDADRDRDVACTTVHATTPSRHQRCSARSRHHHTHQLHRHDRTRPRHLHWHRCVRVRLSYSTPHSLAPPDTRRGEWRLPRPLAQSHVSTRHHTHPRRERAQSRCSAPRVHSQHTPHVHVRRQRPPRALTCPSAHCLPRQPVCQPSGSTAHPSATGKALSPSKPVTSSASPAQRGSISGAQSDDQQCLIGAACLTLSSAPSFDDDLSSAPSFHDDPHRRTLAATSPAGSSAPTRAPSQATCAPCE